MPERVSGKHNGKDILPGGNDKSARQLESSMRVQASGEKIYNGKRADKENGHLFVYSSNLELTGMLRKEKKESSWKRIKGNVKGLADNHRACPNIVN